LRAFSPPFDRDVEAVVEMMLDATQHYADSLTEERLFGWHASLFPAGRSGMHRTRACWGCRLITDTTEAASFVG
jgi:hypothetical protein